MGFALFSNYYESWENKQLIKIIEYFSNTIAKDIQLSV